MGKTLPDREMIVRYLLGEINDAEQLDMVEQYFENEELYNELLEVEARLLDEYASDRLEPDKKKRFAAYLNRLPDGKEKLAFANSLKQIVDEEVAPTNPDVVKRSTRPSGMVSAEAPPAFWQMVVAFLRRRASSVSVAVCLLAAVLGLVWLSINQGQISEHSQRLQEQLAQREAQDRELRAKLSEMERDLQDTRDRIDKLSGELNQERLKSEQQAQEIARLREQPSPFEVWTLTASRRVGGPPDEMTLRRGRKYVRIEVPIGAGEPQGSYSAVLQTTEAQQILEQRGLRAISGSRGKVVVWRVDADRFTGSVYKLTLVAPDGVTFEYYFRVTKR
jgi:negative regulator of sigma E activity